MKQLVLIRHAKSSWKDPALTDLQRPLKKRGERDAREMARRLKVLGLDLQTVLMSPALRVTQTIGLMAEETAFGEGITHMVSELYTFSYQDLLLYLKGLDDGIDRVAIAGHNPAITDLVNFLAGEELANVPTCGIALLNLDCPHWSALRAGGAHLDHYDYPKNDPGE